MKNNQTWNLAQEFPNVAGKGVEALREWVEKNDAQRERLLVLQHYAANRDTRMDGASVTTLNREQLINRLGGVAGFGRTRFKD